MWRGEKIYSEPACQGDRESSLAGVADLASRPISRVLSWTTIPLGPASPRTSSGLPESSASHTSGFLFGLAPGGVCHAMVCCHPCGALLPHHFTLTPLPNQVQSRGGILSVALSVGSRLPGVTWHLALWSPDFPRGPILRSGRRGCLADSRRVYVRPR